MARTKN